VEQPILFREFEPDARLKDYIKSYWYFSVRTEATKPFDILPDGCFDVLVIRSGGNAIATRLTGIWSKTVTVSYSGSTEVLGIRFTPLAIGSVLKFSAKDYLNASADINLLDLGIAPNVLCDEWERFNAHPYKLLNYLDSHFLRMLQRSKTDLRLKNCFDLVHRSAGGAPVGYISGKVGISPRQLHRLLTSMVGIGLKDYSKIIRFKVAVKQMQSSRFGYGDYYDQSHFIREVKHFTGSTPRMLDFAKNDRFVQYYCRYGL